MKKLLLLFLLTFCTLFSWAAGQNSFTDDSNNRKVFQKPIENGSKLTIRGDVNEDGIVNVNDITEVAKIILGAGGDVIDSLKCPDNNHPHMIDLGLPSGTMWCCCNVGATTPEGYGGYYAWGETNVKNVYSWDTYAYGSSEHDCQNIGSNIARTLYDVAYVVHKDTMCMPSYEQFDELLKNCTQEWTQQNGVNGIMLTGPNCNRIFLPAAGYRLDDKNNRVGLYGYYWSGSLANDNSAYCFNFDSGLWGLSSESRSFGQSVRAVCGQYSSGVTVTLDTIEVTTNSATMKIALEGELENINEVRVYFTEDSISEPNIELDQYKSFEYSPTPRATKDTINCVLDNLQDSTIYYSFVSVKTENDIICSNVISFTTDTISGVKVTLSDSVEVTTDSATLEIALKGELEKIDSVRVYYTKDKITEPNIELDQYKSFEYSPTPGATNDTINCVLDNLQDSTTYYSFVSVKTNDSIYYSNVESFTTKVRVISGVEINILDPDEITKESATLKIALEGELEKIDSVRVYFAEDSITEASIEHCQYKNIIYTYQGVTKDTINCVLNSLQSITTYYYLVHIITDDSTYCSNMASFKTLSKYKTPKDAEAIDLGLSVKWAPYNMGANSVGDYGGLYGWGDPTGELTSTSPADYGPSEPLTDIQNTEYDIAHVQWGSHWRLPTAKELMELFESCDCSSTIDYQGSGVYGFILKSKKNGQEVFIPAAGYKTETELTKEKSQALLWTCQADENGTPFAVYMTGRQKNSITINRAWKLSIRPVYDENPGPGPDPGPGPEEPEDSVYANAVDLGLSVLWADKNVGADDSNPYGDFYRWGEIDTNNTTSYYRKDYKYYIQGTDNDFMYLGESISGKSEYDAATANWGKRWRMPKDKEINEMIENCDITLDLQDGIYGYKVVSKINGNSIFLPAAGYKFDDQSFGKLDKIGSYWSGTSYDLIVSNHNKFHDWCYIFSLNVAPSVYGNYRYYGRLIRPVRDKK